MAKDSQVRRTVLWMAALVLGAVIGLLGIDGLKPVIDFIATVYTRLFRLLAVPTIALAVTTTLASFGSQRETGMIFRRTITYTLLTTSAAALVGLGLYLIIDPAGTCTATDLLGAADDNLSAASDTNAQLSATGYYDHFISVIPDNIVRPLSEGNVLSVLLISAAAGMALVKMPQSERRDIVVKGLLGLQDLLFTLIRWLIITLPIGIAAFAAQFTAQMSEGVAAGQIGRYVTVILAGNAVQFFIVLPLFLLLRGINPVTTLRRMMPAVLMALFTKSSAATLPVTMQTAEQRLNIGRRVSRFVLPVCTTINMNGCAAFVLVTSLFVMQSTGIHLSAGAMLIWLVIAVVSAIGNAGVPMGCYFLTLSLMTGIGVPVAILGLILPVYTLIDMVETAENVWSDSCVCAMTAADLEKSKQ